ncbi:MAG: 1,4-dihydroxy-6-naphthoate synthase [Desulfobacteraceae bacterium]|nr:1,4-dihydroxy-6-naphthoate synthase [Desulfobacteraceae bacterium]
MAEMKELSIAYSSCPNDTFIFNALVHDLIDTQGLKFNVALFDVETLNKKASEACYDITKLSFAAFGSVRDEYGLLRTGSALGRGCGPLIISCPGKKLYDKLKPVIAVPGLGTTAYHLLRLYLNDLTVKLGKEINPKIIAMPFEKIMPHVLEGKSDFGVIIHEGRFVYEKLGFDLICDLGKWWEEKTLLPIPLGCIAVKKEIGKDVAEKIEYLIQKSIKYARNNPDAGYEYIKKNAQELDDDVIEQHICLYVNEFTERLGVQGEEAVRVFFDKIEKAGIIPQNSEPLFISDQI